MLFPFHLGPRLVVASALSALAVFPLRGGEIRATVAISSGTPIGSIPTDFAGLSYEVSTLLPAPDGQHYFRPDNTGLAVLFRSLGIGSLRIGGNTSDRNAGQLPGRADLDALFGFARVAGVKVIYCLRLHDGDPAADAATAKYIMDRYAPWVDCFSIGQEPSAYPFGQARPLTTSSQARAPKDKFPYSQYRADWLRFAQTIIAAVPDIRFCGPSVHNNANWANRFISDFGQGYHVSLITEHLYAGGAASTVPSDEMARDWMLSSHFTAAYERLYRGMAAQLKSAHLPYRLEETNSYFNGGRRGASDTFTAALWGLDYLYWWAEHGCAGLNFHTGDSVSMNGGIHAPAYGVFTSRTDGYDIKPLAYALKAFSLAGHGPMLPVVMHDAPAALSAFAVRSDDRLTVTLINRSHDQSAQDIKITLRPGDGWNTAEMVILRDDNGDIAARSGITLGGSPLDLHGGWHGHWQPLGTSQNGSEFLLAVPAATAAIVRLTRH